jgi:UDP-glucuronate 4-epimerase
MNTIFITGMAGMIGFHSAKKFHELGWKVTGVDNFNDYYDVNLKFAREKILMDLGMNIINADIQNPKDYEHSIEEADVVLHLAAYANPRHAMEEPQHYIDTNITGTQRILEVAERDDTPVVYASSSCVMHGQPLPWNEHDRPGHQNNPYGWSKRSNECQFMHSRISKTTGLRFFTVYGPYGRPDMALFKFTDAILDEVPLTLYNFGDMRRDFTYVDDIVQGVVLVTDDILKPAYHDSMSVRHEIYNIGYGEQVELMDFVNEIEKNLNRKGTYDKVPAHPADAPETWSDTTKLQGLGYKPTTPISEGVKQFISWYKDYYNVN